MEISKGKDKPDFARKDFILQTEEPPSEAIVSSYETIAMLAALLAGFSISAIDFETDSHSRAVAQYFFLVIGCINLYSTCVMGLVAFYIHQLKEKHPISIPDFCKSTKSVRNLAQRVSIATVPALMIAFSLQFLEDKPFISLSCFFFALATTYSIWKIYLAFHYIRKSQKRC